MEWYKINEEVKIFCTPIIMVVNLMINNDRVVYTIGHSNFTIEEFITLLNKYDIKKIVDIRSVPYSRYYPQFNIKRLSCALSEHGIEYIFDGERLGGRIPDESCYLNKHLPTRKNNIAELVDYDMLKTKDWFNSGINDLFALVQGENIAIMCSEENPTRCHRNLLVARRLFELGVKVYHIRKSILEPANFNEQISISSLYIGK